MFILLLPHIYPIIQDIHTFLHKLRQREVTNASFIWIPGHSGNIDADFAVKEAATSTATIERTMPCS